MPNSPILIQYHHPDSPEFACLDCTLPECYESYTCPYWQARGKTTGSKQGSRWASLIEEVRELEPGGLLVKKLSFKDARSAQASVCWHARQGVIPGQVKTWRIQEGESGLLNILKKGG